jgi:centromeric protein E
LLLQLLSKSFSSKVLTMKRVFRSAKKATKGSASKDDDSGRTSPFVGSAASVANDAVKFTDIPKSASTMTTVSSSSLSTASVMDPVASLAETSSTRRSPPVPTVPKANVQVCARIRPLAIPGAKEDDSFFSAAPKRRTFLPIPSSRKNQNNTPSGTKISKDESFVAWDVAEDTASQSNKTEKIQGRTHTYTLDKVFDTNATTHEVYQTQVESLVQAAMEGYHSTVLAYGQTSTGKTFTMSGTKESPGLVALSIQDCFRFVQETDEPREYLFRLSMLEIYKEHIRDLLSNKSPPEPVRLFDGPSGLIIRGLKEEVVTSAEQVFALLKHGERRRQVGATHMNQHSSRSHVMVRLWIESTSSENANDETRVSSLSLVDLAGSESVRLNGADRREEGQYINKSLMTLGQVVLSLSDASSGNNKKGTSHIPYRDSKLTRLLQPSLSGNAQMLLLCCISPLASHLEESHNTFKFAARAKRIEQKATIQTVQDKDETLLQTYRDEIEDLRLQLAEAKEQQRQLLELQMQQLPIASTIAATTMTTPGIQNGFMQSSTEEIEELVEAISKMEHLILKSRPHQHGPNPSVSKKLDETLASLLQSDDDDDGSEEEMLLEDHADIGKTSSSLLMSSPENDAEDQLHSELSRIRGLLGSVLQKRGVIASQTASATPEKDQVRKSLDYATPQQVSRTPDRSLEDELNAVMPFDELIESEEKKSEVESLRKQLEEYERTTNLRKADSSFLQAQLEEKDKLLEEVSNLLEAVEQRQAELEKENAELKREVAELRRVSL